MTRIVPAVPSNNGVADVFAFLNDGTVRAITSEGSTAWTADVSMADAVIPDFQGGLITTESAQSLPSISKYDGVTGQKRTLYTSSWFDLKAAVAPDGTVFAADRSRSMLVGIDSVSGSQRFAVPISASNWQPVDTGLIVAGDGYAYFPYAYAERSMGSQRNHLRLLRVNSIGATDDFSVMDWTTDIGDLVPLSYVYMITNATTGVLLSWPGGMEFHSAVTTGTSVSLLSGPSFPADYDAVQPVVQMQDGSFLGTVTNGSQQYMVAFDAAGSVTWTVANDSPLMATEDGGVVGESGIIYTSAGRATGQVQDYTQSWRGNTYEKGSIVRFVLSAPATARTLWANRGGSPSGNFTASRPWYFKVVWKNTCSGQSPPCGLYVYPDNPEAKDNIVVGCESQAGIIKKAALDALKAAYSGYRVSVSEGTPGTGDHRANVVNGHVFDDKRGMNAYGLTVPLFRSNDSSVFYQSHMEQAQWAMPLVLRTLVDTQSAATNAWYMKAIGTGIGNTAAHEIAHQFLLDTSGMDDTSLNTYNGAGGSGDRQPWLFGFGTIQWSGVTAAALRSELERNPW